MAESDRIVIETKEEKNETRRPIFLNRQNLYECRHQFVYDDDHTLTEKPGHFARYANNDPDYRQVFFYLTVLFP